MIHFACAGENSGIRKRHLHHSEEMIGSHPGFLDRTVPSLGARMRITDDTVPELAAAAAAKAIAEWGRPAADITHLVLSTNSSVVSPGPDLRVAALLGLCPTVQRTVLYLHGCSAGCSALRLAKDIAESNPGARVLATSADANVCGFHAPDEAHLDVLVVNSLFGDGAGAVIIGAEPVTTVERVAFHMVATAQATLPGTERTVRMRIGESGVEYHMSAELPGLVRGSIERCLMDALAPLGLAGGGDWNGLFWAAHPGGRAILDSYEAALRLQPEKLAASRHVLSEYGNMLGATIIFVLDEMRRRRKGGREDSEWGIVLGLGPGLTVDTMVLNAPGRHNEE
jgi:predicted naringenin-chalcone synthase